MSDDLAAKMRSRMQPTSRPAAEVFASPSDSMQRATVYLPKATVRGLKQFALDRDTSMSRILTELAEGWLAEQRKTQ